MAVTKPRRTCETCAWMTEDDLNYICHYEPKELDVYPEYWCRHWAKDTGWLDEEDDDEK